MPSFEKESSDSLQLRILDPRTGRQEKPLRIAKILATYRNAQVLEDFPLTGSAAGRRFEAIRSRQAEIRAHVNGEDGADELPSQAELRELGTWLFECLFPGAVRDLYHRMSSSSDGRRLGIVLTSMIPWIADLPWEFAYDPVRRVYLAAEEINFVRNVVTATPADEAPPRPGALRILVVAAQPLGWGPISAAEEIDLVSRGFRPLRDQGLVEFEVICRATPQALHEALHEAQLRSRTFDVLHFIGHGEYSEKLATGCLIFEDERGSLARMDTESLRQVARQRGLRVLFLNACETGSGSPVDFNHQGVAQGLVAGGVPVVVGNQYKVVDRSATVFAHRFYWALARGATVGDAAREARVAVSYSIAGELIDWAVPVVFAQNPAEVLCPSELVKKETDSQRSTTSRLEASGAKRAPRSGASRIGLWDVNGALPRLAEIVQRLNEVQGYFDFQTVELMAPIGTWRLDRRKVTGEETYLPAEQVVSRIADKPTELGLRKLLCISTFRLSDRQFFKLVTWDEQPYPNDQIALLSLAGFEHHLGNPALPLERAITNFVGGSLTPAKHEPEDPRDCPCRFNAERDPQLLAGEVTPCPQCEARLEKRIKSGELRPQQVEAVRAILRAYSSNTP